MAIPRYALLFLICLYTTIACSQNGGIRILPEGGLSIPTGDFKSQNVFADQGLQGGLNLDVFFGKFGLGLYGGRNSNSIQYEDRLPSASNLISSRSSRITKDSWKQLLVGLGPIYKMDLSEKLNLEFSLKVGFSKFTFPDYAESIETGAPLSQRYLMYETRNQDVKDKLNLATIPAMRISFKPSAKVSISLSAKYTHAKGIEHSYRYLDGGFNPEMSDDELAAALRTAPTNTEVWKCDFNSIGITLGVGFMLGKGKDKPKEDKKEEQKMEPPVPTYPEDESTITLQEADSLVLEWLKETPNVEKANYNMWLYVVKDSTRNRDSLVYQTKVNRQHKYLLPDDVRLESGLTYRWKVQAVDATELKPCPGDCYSIQVTFKVDQMLRPQYYQMLSQNRGNYIESKNTVRIEIPRNVHIGGKLNGRVMNALQEEVIVLEDLAPNQKSDKHEIDAYGRMSVDIRKLPSGYYVFILSNERKETFYFRFIIPEKDATKSK